MTSPTVHDRARVLAAFAHPDDETLTAGGLLALLARRADVTVVTGNRGERGDVIPADIAHLEGDGPALAAHREGELAAALAALGVADHHYLDSLPGLRAARPARYTDSGMLWTPGSSVRAEPAPDAAVDAFSRADVDVAARVLAGLVRRARPHLVITEEPDGGYGHPDHVQIHRVTMRAVELAAEDGPTAEADDPLAGLEPWRTPLLAWAVRTETSARAASRWLAGRDDVPRLAASGAPLVVPDPGAETPSIVVPDGMADLEVDVTRVAPQVVAAIGAHRSQVQAGALVPGGAEPAAPPDPAGAHTALAPGADTELAPGAHTEPAPGAHTAPAPGATTRAEPAPAVGWFALSNDILQPIPARAALRLAPGWGTAAELRAFAVRCGLVPDQGGAGSAAPGAGGAAPGADEDGAPRWYAPTMTVLTPVLGLMVAAAGTAFHRWEQPWGLVLGLVAVLAGGALARAFADARGLVLYGAAVVVTVLAVTYVRPGGDVVVTSEPIGTAWLFASIVAAAAAALLPRRWFSDGL